LKARSAEGPLATYDTPGDHKIDWLDDPSCALKQVLLECADKLVCPLLEEFGLVPRIDLLI